MRAPHNCTIQTGSQSVTVGCRSVGARYRRSNLLGGICVSVTCGLQLRTTRSDADGTIVWVCDWRDDCYEQTWTDLGSLGPSGLMTANLPGGQLLDRIESCSGELLRSGSRYVHGAEG